MNAEDYLDGATAPSQPSPQPRTYTAGPATVFGLNLDGSPDRQDNGIGAWGTPTNNTDIVGVSLPIKVIRDRFGKGDAAHGRLVEVINPETGATIVAPIVDKGPAAWTGNALDLTHRAAHMLGSTGKNHMAYRILDDQEHADVAQRLPQLMQDGTPLPLASVRALAPDVNYYEAAKPPAEEAPSAEDFLGEPQSADDFLDSPLQRESKRRLNEAGSLDIGKGAEPTMTEIAAEPLPKPVAPDIQLPPGASVAEQAAVVAPLADLQRQREEATAAQLAPGYSPLKVELEKQDAAERQRLRDMGLSDAEISRRLSDLTGLAPKTAARLSDGTITVSPELAFSPDQWEAAARSVGGSEEEVQRAIKERMNLREFLAPEVDAAASRSIYRQGSRGANYFPGAYAAWLDKRAQAQGMTDRSQLYDRFTEGDLLEEFYKETGTGLGNVLSQSGHAMSGAVSSVGQGVYGFADMVTPDFITGKGLQNMADQSREMGDETSRIRHAMGGGWWAQRVANVAGAAVSTMPAFLGAPAGLSGMALAGGAIQAGQTQNDALSAGYSPGQALAMGVGSGAVEAGLTAAFGASGVEAITAAKGTQGIGRRFLTGAASELPEELLQQAGQIPFQQATDPNYKPTAEEFLDVGLASALMGGSMHVMHGEHVPVNPPVPGQPAAPSTGPALAPGAVTNTVDLSGAVPPVVAAPISAPGTNASIAPGGMQTTANATPAPEPTTASGTAPAPVALSTDELAIKHGIAPELVPSLRPDDWAMLEQRTVGTPAHASAQEFVARTATARARAAATTPTAPATEAAPAPAVAAATGTTATGETGGVAAESASAESTPAPAPEPAPNPVIQSIEEQQAKLSPADQEAFAKAQAEYEAELRAQLDEHQGSTGVPLDVAVRALGGLPSPDSAKAGAHSGELRTVAEALLEARRDKVRGEKTKATVLSEIFGDNADPDGLINGLRQQGFDVHTLADVTELLADGYRQGRQWHGTGHDLASGGMNADLPFSQQSGGAKVSVGHVRVTQTLAEKLMKKMGLGKVRVQVVQTLGQMPDVSARQHGRQTGNLIEAYRAKDGGVVLNLEHVQAVARQRNQTTESRVRQLLIHEAIGHGGIAALFAGRLGDWHAATERLFARLKDSIFSDADTKRLGYRTLRELAALYGFDMTTTEGRAGLIEEHVARISEAGIKPAWWTAFVARIKDALNKLGYGKGATTDEQIAEILGRARKAAQSHGEATATQIRLAQQRDPATRIPVQSPRGGASFGVLSTADIRSLKGFTEGSIHLPTGAVFNEFQGFGLAHIEARHGTEIRALGMSPEQFVQGVIDGWTTNGIHPRTGRVVLRTAKAEVILDQLKDGEWTVVTAYSFGFPGAKREQLKNESRRTVGVSAQTASAAAPQLPAGQSPVKPVPTLLQGTQEGRDSGQNTNPANDVKLSQQPAERAIERALLADPKDLQEHGLTERMRNMEGAPDAVKTMVGGLYATYSDPAALADATRWIGERTEEQAVRELLALENGQGDKLTFTAAQLMVERLHAAGEHTTAGLITQKLASIATTFGQAIQSLHMMLNLGDAATVLSFAQKEFAKAATAKIKTQEGADAAADLTDIQGKLETAAKVNATTTLDGLAPEITAEVTAEIDALKTEVAGMVDAARTLATATDAERTAMQGRIDDLDLQLRLLQQTSKHELGKTQAELEEVRKKLALARKALQVEKGRGTAGHIAQALAILANSHGLTAERQAELLAKMRSILTTDDGSTNTIDRLKGVLIAAGMRPVRAGALAKRIVEGYRARQKRVRESLIRQLAEGAAPRITSKLPKGDVAKWLKMNSEGMLDDGTLFAGIAKRWGFPTFTSADAGIAKDFVRRYNSTNSAEVKLAIGAEMMDWLHSHTSTATFMDKASALYRLTKLMSFKTLFRIVGGNVAAALLQTVAIDLPYYGLTTLGVVVGGKYQPLQTAMHATIDGVRESVRIFREGKVHAEAGGKSGVRGGLDVLLHAAKAHTGGVYDAGTLKRQASSVFSGRAMRGFENFMHFMLTVPDYPRFAGEVRQSLARSMQREGNQVPTAEQYEKAYLDAQRSVWLNRERASKVASAMTKVLNLASTFGMSEKFGLGTVVMPFTTVPANLAVEGAKWTPLGFVQALYEGVRDFGSGDQRTAAHSLLKASVGTAALGKLGAYLFALGILTAGDDDDRDVQKLRELAGWQRYSVNASELKRRLLNGDWMSPAKGWQDGDMVESYAFLQPAAFALAAGAERERLARKYRSDAAAGKPVAEEGWWTSLAQPLAGSAKAFTDQPLTMGLSVVGDDIKRMVDEGDPTQMLSLFSRALDFVPSIVRDVRYGINDSLSETRHSNAVIAELNRIVGGVPMSGLPQRFDILGRAQHKYDAARSGWLNALFNPLTERIVRQDPVVAEALRLWSATNDKGVIPDQTKAKVNINTTPDPRTKRTILLNTAQISEHQRLTGQLTASAMTFVMSHPAYSRWPDAIRAREIGKQIAAASNAAKMALFNDCPLEVTPTGARFDAAATAAYARGVAAGIIKK